MPVCSTRCRAAALALVLPGLLSTAAAAQKSGGKDLQTISAYTLTMPKYTQMTTAMMNLGKAAQMDPSLAAALENSGNLSLDDMAARFDGVPPLKKAIGDAGLTPREFAVAQGAALQAGMAYGIMKQYKLSPDSVSKSTGVSKANLEFIRVHEAEIERMGREMQAQMPQGEGEKSDAAGSESADSGQ